MWVVTTTVNEQLSPMAHALFLLRCPAVTAAAAGRPCDRLVGVTCEGLLGPA